ncbi:glycosyltransferase family A protein [Nocardioides houyundeii]|uniref:glycosyltransferase family A protein n=1 Tax=Nocardioides houyundeii TaxID=2045452 RepID=UPI000DF37E06|nr:glycosyltransferase family A protein [Nocardioides houyundeii]
MVRRRVAVSVVSVWNDEAVLGACLDRSVRELRHTAPETELVAVDNRGQRCATAGSALNEGVREATRDVVAFVQQDIYLHSLVALEEAAALLTEDPSLAMVGAVGIDADGRVRGRIRDRVVLIGEVADSPVPVDSLDEVLFLARRQDLLEDPLSEDPDLAWHAYAVEWGLRGRARDRAVAAVDIPLTHNSLSTNLARLDEAHAAVAALHPDLLPLHTTCGVITAGGGIRAPRRPGLLTDHRWRLRWAKGSWALRAAGRAAGSSSLVLGDLRRDVDRVAAHVPGRLRIHDLVPAQHPFPDAPGGTCLPRAGYDVWFTSGSLAERPAPDRPDDACLWTNVTLTDLTELGPALAGAPHVIGYHDDIGYWVLTGEAARRRDEIWTDPRSRPARLPV